MSDPVRLLHLLPPETAHRAAIRLLPWLPARRLPVRPRLHTRLAGLDLPHPLGLAAGFDKNGEAYAALLRQGFAFVEVGTVTPRPQPGNPRPRLFRLAEDRAIVNRMGFNNEGAAALAARLRGRDPGRGIVGVNIGMNKDASDPLADYVRGLETFYPLVDYVTVNVSSPNTPGLRALQKREALDGLLGGLVAARKRLETASGTARPLFLKIAPDLEPEDEASIAELAVLHGIDGLIVSNTTVVRSPDLRSPLARESGGLSGRPLFAPSTRLLARMALLLDGKVPLIGVGGIATGADAYAKIRAGASAVQLYTALIYEGPGIVRRILEELDALLARDGFAHIGDAVGCHARALAAADERR
ncbi:quinone-dependent dihydroorotate dehydrogenase [Benzoatithermus flavus]|uniref:Dihydroorotate dehydrogenase (quinone) n=1 Tax=Benzoatithermus flavus TaxID=3108223 RepID=A0ABU8XY64_9PROT